MRDTQECQHIYYYTRPAMYYCMYNNIHMYPNIPSFDNSIVFSITYHTFSMELKFMISLEVHMHEMTSYISQL